LAETLSVINLLSAYLQKELLSAERASFGRKTTFRQGRYTLVVYCYPTLWPKTLQPVSKWHDPLQKDTLSAERLYFGRISVSAEIHNSKAGPFGYQQKEEKSLSFDL